MTFTDLSCGSRVGFTLPNYYSPFLLLPRVGELKGYHCIIGILYLMNRDTGVGSLCGVCALVVVPSGSSISDDAGASMGHGYSLKML